MKEDQLQKADHPWENFDTKNMRGEVWVDLIGYDGVYEVSNFGRIKSLRKWVNRSTSGGYFSKERIRKPGIIRHHSYRDQFSLYIPLTIDGVTSNFTVARIVLESFGRIIGPDQTVHHVNGKSHDNRLSNLTIDDKSRKIKNDVDMGLYDYARALAAQGPQSKAFAARSRDEIMGSLAMARKAKKPSTFSKRNAMTVTFSKGGKDYVYSSLRAAAIATGEKEHSLRNALYRPHKYKRFAVTLGTKNIIP